MNIKKCVEAIIENAGLNLTKEYERIFLDNKRKIGVISPGKGKFWFFKKERKEYYNFAYLYENDNGTKSICLVVRDGKELKSVEIYSYGSDIVVRDSQNHSEAIVNFFNCVDNYIVRYDDNNEKIIAPQEYKVQDIYDEICNAIVNIDDSENWKNVIGELLEFAKPALILFIEKSKEIWLKRISSIEASAKERYDTVNTEYEKIKEKRNDALKEYCKYKDMRETLENETVNSIKK